MLVLSLKYECTDRTRIGNGRCRLSIYPKVIVGLLIALVHYNNHEFLHLDYGMQL
jgi:hypothetical protein